jgi:hypothetical protein
VADYNVFIELYDDNYPTEYAGKLWFTIVILPNGWWYISRWQDVQFNTADSKETFSFLKAHFHN